VALVLIGAFLISEAILSHVYRIGWSGDYGWQRILAIACGAGAMLAGGIRLVQTVHRWPSETELVAFGRRCAPFLVAATLYTGAFLIMGPFPEGDQPRYELESIGLAYDQTRDMTKDYADRERWELPFPFGVTTIGAVRYKRGGELVEIHNVGLPLLLAPAVPWTKEFNLLSAGKARWPWHLEIILFAALAAHLLYRILRRLRPERPALVAGVWASVAFSAPVVVYASQVYPEMPATLLALIAVSALLKPSRSTLVFGGFALAGLPWLHVRFLPVAVLLAVALAIRARDELPIEQRNSSIGVRRAAWAIVPLALSLVVMAVAFQHWYGSPWPNAQYRGPNSTPRTLSASWTALAGGLWSSQKGWLPYAPICILGLASIGYCARRYLVWTLFGLGVAVAYLLPITIQGSDIGFSFPGRYELILMPFTALPLLVAAGDLAVVRRVLLPVGAMFTLYLTLAVVLEPPPAVSGVAGIHGPTFAQLLWPWFVHLWPQVVASAAHFYPDAGAVLGWSVGLAAISVAGYFLPVRSAHPTGDRIVGASTLPL
jgi:hypothetical protein